MLLDANLPGDVAVDEEFGGEPPPDDWRQTLEHIDKRATYEEASELPTRPLDMVVTYIASTEVPPDPEYVKGLRDMQHRFLESFTDGTFIQAAAPHFMEPAIPGADRRRGQERCRARRMNPAWRFARRSSSRG